MATGLITVTVVDVGQGQCTFLEIWDDSSPAELIETVLIDCGSDKKSDNTETNLKYIVDRVSGMAVPAFDCIIFSHSDKDHVNLTQELLEMFKPAKKPVVRKVWYGGDYDQYVKYGVNILDYLQTKKYCTKKNIVSPGSYKTSYDDTTGKFDFDPLWESDDGEVVIQAIVANVLSDDPDWDSNDEDLWGAKAEEKNRVSIICGIYFGGASYIICGDATNVTMSATNQHFKGTKVFGNTKMTTLPHHGSRATGFAVAKGKDPSKEAVKVVDTFAKLLKSKSLTASAFEKHRHPSLQLMNAFLPTVPTPFLYDARLKQKNVHRLTAYVDVDIEIKAPPSSSGASKKKKTSGATLSTDAARSFDSITRTFTTRYTNNDTVYSYNLGNKQCEDSQGVNKNATTKRLEVINPHASWQWDSYGDGTAKVGGYATLKLPLVLFTNGIAAMVIKPGGPLGRRAVWEFDKDGNEITGNESKRSPVTVRTKSRAARQPATPPLSFQRLQQFF
nr:hypothetical protein [uncultured Chitinophaga sp.]